MRPDDLRELLRRQPFRPFRLFVSDGATYDVIHPEMAHILRATIQIILPASGILGIPVERMVLVSFIHITRVEVFPPGGMFPSH